MIKINRLYSEPEIFTPISFDFGVNIIMGEKSEKTNKKIGVGKSVCIEFINFCLLKRKSDSRLNLIPKKNADIIESQIKLDFDFNNKKVVVSRSISNPEKVSIQIDDENIYFEKLDDASDYLGNLYFQDYPAKTRRLSFRNLLQPIIRDERSEFKDLIKCFDTNKSVPPDYSPHLFFLNVGLEKYKEIKNVNETLKKKRAFYSETKKLVTNNSEIKIQDAKAHLNELESEVEKVNKAIENLKTNESFELIQEDLVKLEAKLADLRTRQQAIKYEIKQIDSFPKPESINENEIQIIFNQFKSGLGNLVEKSLEDLKEFKNKIDGFRSSIVNDRLTSLKNELSELNSIVRKLDEEYSEKISLIDNGEVLKDLKTSIRVFNEKNRELNNLRSLIQKYDESERDKKKLEADKAVLISDLEEELYKNEKALKSFKESILNIHEKIMGNREAHFEIKTTKNQSVVDFIMRTDDDGSHSTERMKVFIYDIALLLNEYTRTNHPGFLIHDNIFEDDDSIEKSLNFLFEYNNKTPNEFQYIVTLNSDLIESASRNGKLLFKVDDLKRAAFTKDDRFLGIKYNETK
ncbi:hypothetical protein OB69_00050 [Roseivirga seohaensis subsp. aquiponti]|uniref:DUF2326 domain-containing protein n=1 Tax=Roseivirga seohaensis subsp. aquiponti TaxID=1566026 RepID=A0A0L8AQH5_9BACT|nr:DUF2326 domain-containing protein [Roseivirga seohaensis]KOF04496.1 hypothetical protein OB69_00050 [Roseivirga seohaensis subsp. aquiponti]